MLTACSSLLKMQDFCAGGDLLSHIIACGSFNTDRVRYHGCELVSRNDACFIYINTVMFRYAPCHFFIAQVSYIAISSQKMFSLTIQVIWCLAILVALRYFPLATPFVAREQRLVMAHLSIRLPRSFLAGTMIPLLIYGVWVCYYM
jgi:hypothetical protein